MGGATVGSLKPWCRTTVLNHPDPKGRGFRASSFTEGSCASFESAESVAGGPTHSWRLYGQDLRGGTGNCGSIVSLLQAWPLCDAMEDVNEIPLQASRSPYAPAGGLCDNTVAAGGCPDVTASSCSGRWGGTPLSLFSGCRGFRGRGGDDITVPLFSEMRCHQGALHHPTAFLHPTRTLC